MNIDIVIIIDCVCYCCCMFVIARQKNIYGEMQEGGKH